MKKYKILIILLISFSFNAVAQNKNQTSSAAVGGEKIMTVEEANALNGKAEPKMADGKPYSQYKAEVEAKNKQQATLKPATVPQVPAQFKIDANKTWAGKPVELQKPELNNADLQPAKIATPEIKLAPVQLNNLALPVTGATNNNIITASAVNITPVVKTEIQQQAKAQPGQGNLPRNKE